MMTCNIGKVDDWKDVVNCKNAWIDFWQCRSNRNEIEEGVCLEKRKTNVCWSWGRKNLFQNEETRKKIVINL
jgi:hypothetical protein